MSYWNMWLLFCVYSTAVSTHQISEHVYCSYRTNKLFLKGKLKENENKIYNYVNIKAILYQVSLDLAIEVFLYVSMWKWGRFISHHINIMSSFPYTTQYVLEVINLDYFPKLFGFS